MKHLVAILILLPLLYGCGKADMADQPKYKPYRPAALFSNGTSNQTSPDQTVARDDDTLRAQLAVRPAMTADLLVRGQDRYDIFCTPCHDAVGDGNGLVVQRGFPRPPDFHQDRLQRAADAQLMDVIADGYGAMYPLGGRIPGSDRWAIVAYIRALQLSQHAPVATLSTEQRRAVEQASP